MNVSTEGAGRPRALLSDDVISGDNKTPLTTTILIINRSRIDLLGLSARDKSPVMHHASIISVDANISGDMWHIQSEPVYARRASY